MACQCISPELAAKGFKKCCISKAVDKLMMICCGTADLDKHIFPWQTYFLEGCLRLESSFIQVNMVIILHVCHVHCNNN